jgi:HEAT repeat protein
MVRALEDEALEYEGRPGAGLGIQIPVRSVLLYALGEAGAHDQIGLLIRYLSNTHGSVMGGFYLPAMDALVKLNAVDELAKLVQGPELLAANALGVLGMLGQLSVVRASLSDSRPRVAAAACQALELS